jgi:hypothetical protein
MNPQCGGRALGKDGIRRRVTGPCNATNGNSASDARTPATSLTRERGLPEPENTSVQPRSISEQSPTLSTIVIAAALPRLQKSTALPGKSELERTNPNRSQPLKLENQVSN